MQTEFIPGLSVMLSRLKRWGLLALVGGLLSACGGGGGSSGSSPFDNGGNSSVADLRIELSSSVLSTATQGSVTATVVAVNASNVVVSNATVAISADNGAAVTAGGTTTDDSGSISATVGIGSDSSPRVITVTAVSGKITRQAQFQVVNGSTEGTPTLVPTLSSTSVSSLSPPTVTVLLKDALGQPISNTVVTLSSVRSLGTFSATTVLTGSDGKASTTLAPVSSTTNGADEVLATATVGGVTISGTVGFSVTPTTVTISSFASDIGSGTLGAYGQANFSVALSGVTNGSPVSLSISSVCVRKNKAVITPTEQTVTSAAASFTYVDQGCGADTVTDSVTVSISGTTTSASASLNLSSPTVSSLGFVSASPDVIYLRGSGYTEVSNVTFLVKDENGNPLPGKTVTLEPTTLAGGLTLNGGSASVTQVSDAAGKVTVRVNAGTVPTPVRILAKMTVGSKTVQTVSSKLGIAVGLASQLNFSLSQETVNIEGGNTDGESNTYVIFASDRMGNPVPDGTTVNFVVESGGQIEAVKHTSKNVSGISTTVANFVSQEPRPADNRITVVAYALGEEAFIDANPNNNANNVYDSGESFQDLGDVFLSRRFVQDYDSTVDQVIARALNRGVTCAVPSGPADPSAQDGRLLLALDRTIPSVRGNACDGIWSPNMEYVRRATETVLSYSSSRLFWSSAGGGTVGSGCSKYIIPIEAAPVDTSKTQAKGTFFAVGGSAVYGLSSAGTLGILVADVNTNRLNPMPAGTTVAATATDGLTVSVVGGTPVPSTSEATITAISFKFADKVTSGTISVTTTSPHGVGTTYAFGVSTSALPAGSCQ